MALTKTDRQEFLAEPHVAALAVTAGRRGPLVVPIWYQYAPGGEPWILTPAASRKADLIAEAGCFTLMVDRVTPTLRYVSVEGEVSDIRPGTEADLVEISDRYLDSDAARRYREMARAEHGPTVVISLRPRHWTSADLG